MIGDPCGSFRGLARVGVGLVTREAKIHASARQTHHFVEGAAKRDDATTRFRLDVQNGLSEGVHRFLYKDPSKKIMP
jgi:hypothetical protein